MVNHQDPVLYQQLQLELVQPLHQHSELLVRSHAALPEQPWVVVAQTHSQSVDQHGLERVIRQFLLVCQHLVADRTHFEADVVLLILAHEFGSEDDADAMAHPACLASARAEQVQLHLHVVHLLEVHTGVLLAHVELGGEPLCGDELGGVFTVVVVH